MGNRSAEIEYEPNVLRASTIRKADFRIYIPSEDWTYVEVTKPDTSEVQNRLVSILTQLSGLVTGIPREFAVEVSFKREPNDSEVAILLDEVKRFCEHGAEERVNIGDLASIVLTNDVPGQITVRSDPDGPKGTRLAAAAMVGGEGQPRRHMQMSSFVAKPDSYRKITLG